MQRILHESVLASGAVTRCKGRTEYSIHQNFTSICRLIVASDQLAAYIRRMAQTTTQEPPIATAPLSNWRLSAWCVVAAFGSYFCMYAFRQPYTAANYDELWGSMKAKDLLVIAQVLGYATSKFIGIKVIAEMPPRARIGWLLGLIAAAETALLLFAVTPSPYRIVWLFVNGLPLGLVFGLVLGFLEGRRHTEALTAGLCTSFIVADGVTKSVGALLLEAGISEWWMPFLVGVIFAPALVFFAWMLSRIPAPSEEDVRARTARTPMNRDERWAFFGRYAFGLTLLAVIYLAVSVLRGLRSYFAPQIWTGLGVEGVPSVFSQSELAVGLGVLLLGGMAVCIRDNRRAFYTAMGLAFAGAVLLGLALIWFNMGLLSPLAFMVLLGLGLYLPYVVFHTTVFERLIALTRDRGNIGYLLYLVDAFGYLGVVLVLLAKNFVALPGDFLDFFEIVTWIVAVVCVACIIPCWRYFAMHEATQKSD